MLDIIEKWRSVVPGHLLTGPIRGRELSGPHAGPSFPLGV